MAITAKVLVVAGGGGSTYQTSGGRTGGGGGAGGLIYTESYSIDEGIYNITVGNGGGNATNGENSVFGTLTAIGGGNGGGTDPTVNPGNGGSGGGGGFDQTLFGTGTTGQGYSGARGGVDIVGAGDGGGGGGSGGAGVAGPGGAGGVGTSNSISGSAVTYATGGHANDTGHGTANTGNGAGGIGSIYTGNSGGSGIVIIRYATADAVNFSIRGGRVTTSGSDTIRTFLTSGQLIIAPLTAPKIASVEAWGTGGVGTDASSSRGAGGSGGGAYAKVNDLYLPSGIDISFPVVIGNDVPTTLAGSVILADFGRRGDGVSFAGGLGGQASNCISDIAYSGGTGGIGTTTGDTSGGGGGSAGPNGAGLNGEDYSTGTGGIGNNGLGGAGGVRSTSNGADNALGGGGGAGGPDAGTGTSGGFPGGGGGGGESGGGSPGAGKVVIKYIPITNVLDFIGGTITIEGDYRVHTFSASGTFSTTRSANIEASLITSTFQVPSPSIYGDLRTINATIYPTVINKVFSVGDVVVQTSRYNEKFIKPINNWVRKY